ncbi:MAG: cpaB [Phenylobacterium sp.]|nr:cpaB [Phenylobacterium sp.]
MLSTRRLLLLGLALLLSAATVLVTQHWLQGQLRQAQLSARAKTAAPMTSRVLVAAQPLPAGTILKAAQLRWQAWPAEASTAGYYTGAATSPEQLAGAVVRTELTAGEPLSAARVVQPGDRSFLAAVLKPGYRGVTVNVSVSTGVAGFVFPGDRVDLILSRGFDGGAGGPRRFVSETVLSDVRVVGIDQRAANEKKDVVIPQSATLEVTPKQAEILTLVSELGKLSLSLRSLATPADGPSLPAAPTHTWDSDATQIAPPHLAAAAAHASRAPRPAAAPAVVVIRGGQASGAGTAQ